MNYLALLAIHSLLGLLGVWLFWKMWKKSDKLVRRLATLTFASIYILVMFSTVLNGIVDFSHVVLMVYPALAYCGYVIAFKIWNKSHQFRYKILSILVAVLYFGLPFTDSIASRLYLKYLCDTDSGIIKSLPAQIDSVYLPRATEGCSAVCFKLLQEVKVPYVEVNVTTPKLFRMATEKGLYRFYLSTRGDRDCSLFYEGNRNRREKGLPQLFPSASSGLPKETCVASVKIKTKKSFWEWERISSKRHRDFIIFHEVVEFRLKNRLENITQFLWREHSVSPGWFQQMFRHRWLSCKNLNFPSVPRKSNTFFDYVFTTKEHSS